MLSEIWVIFSVSKNVILIGSVKIIMTYDVALVLH
jgi:hypothetical protein